MIVWWLFRIQAEVIVQRLVMVINAGEWKCVESTRRNSKTEVKGITFLIATEDGDQMI